MKFNLSYRRKIFLYFSAIIFVFTVGIVFFEQQQIKRERHNSLQSRLNIYAETIHTYINDNNLLTSDSLESIGRISIYFPDDIRISIIDSLGTVLYDNRVDTEKLENHLHRPEVQEAASHGSGSNIRISASNEVEYLYFARKFGDGYYVRIAMPYDLKLQSFLDARNSFIYFIILFFLVCVVMMNYFANQFTRSIQQLRNFSQQLKTGGNPDIFFNEFPDDEVGAISADIVENYKLLQENRKQLSAEREKLLQHFHFSEEGIAIFSKERSKIYANSHFLQYLNLIIDRPTLREEVVFTDPAFAEIQYFLDHPEKENIFTTRIKKNGKRFNIRVIIFDDESFELYIGDITKQEKTRLLKQEMTNNIAHELRTPVTSIRGYLETILNLDEDDASRRNIFLERAYAQTIRLSELIQDIGMLTKIEDAPDRFAREEVKMKELLEELKSDVEDKLTEKNDTFTVEVDDRICVTGSRTLLYTIFRNLIENSLNYAGNGVEISVRCYADTDDTLFFEFYDTGPGVEDKHLVRIFERFYRVNEGRTRNTGGGSGLGLAIVKNAILFHHGSIVAKNRPEGGLSFLITLPKTKYE
ncbi:sensor histidine kinase [Seramator thermalis]|uniref:sensor histidine kinase n=1 Tax=Seramator thermalis TaxID=2496270 RepID=UPI00101C5949|nr:ATP-binding protein [Seramator thermalis]